MVSPQTYTVVVEKVVRYRQTMQIVAATQREAEAIAREEAAEHNAETWDGQWKVVRKGVDNAR